MEMYYGFYQSVVSAGNSGRPLLNFHLVHKAFPKNISVLEAFLEVLGRNSYNDLTDLNQMQRKSLNSYIKGLKVSYQVSGHQKVTYRVNSLAGIPEEEKLDSGLSVMQYFRDSKRYNIKYRNIPLLWVGSDKRQIKIPPELCQIEKDQSIKRKLEDYQTSNMIKVSATNTIDHRENTINRFEQAGYNKSPFVQDFGLRVSDQFEKTEARVLPTPVIQYGNGQEKVNKGVWHNKKFYNPKTIRKWAIVNLDKYTRRSHLESLVQELSSASQSCGLTFEKGPDYPAPSGLNKKDLELFFIHQKKQNYDIIFIVLPGVNGDKAYNNLKHAAEITGGCLTQCIQAKTMQRFSRATASNILLKVNAKLDGINHTFSATSKPKILRELPIMLLGADVTHPPAGPTDATMPSVAAIIASHDPTGFQYNLTIRLQEPTMEYIVDLKEVVKQKLIFFYKKK